jgi:hypothetical protein
MKKGEKAKQGTTDNSNCKLLFFSLPHMFKITCQQVLFLQKKSGFRVRVQDRLGFKVRAQG